MGDLCQLNGPRFEIDIASVEYPAICAIRPIRLVCFAASAIRRHCSRASPSSGPARRRPMVLPAPRCSPRTSPRAAFPSSPVARWDVTSARIARRSMAAAPTVVVFGSGADVTYPKRGRELFQRVIDAQGAVISENPWGTQPLRPTFVRRNRIIAGLAALVLIVEAGLPSGTFSTADAALRANRDGRRRTRFHYLAQLAGDEPSHRPGRPIASSTPRRSTPPLTLPGRITCTPCSPRVSRVAKVRRR